MKKGKQKEKGAAMPFMREPVTIFLGNRQKIRAEGVKRVLVCTEDEVCLRLRQGSLRVQGKELVCTTFSCGAVERVGRVEQIRREGREQSEDSLS